MLNNETLHMLFDIFATQAKSKELHSFICIVK